MITLYDVKTRSYTELERLAYATDDHMYVSVKLLRELLARIGTDFEPASAPSVLEDPDGHES